jgi:hypothetical protein
LLTNLIRVGGGIVFDSDPYDEYIETMNKLRASIMTLEKAERSYTQQQSMGTSNRVKPIIDSQAPATSLRKSEQTRMSLRDES